MIKHINKNETQTYAEAVIVDDKYIYLSGLVSEDVETGELIDGDITEQTKRTLDNLEILLKRYGSDMDHLIRCEIVLKDFSERDEMNKEYMKHFTPGHIPTRICYGNVVLSGTNKIEILATAVKKD